MCRLLRSWPHTRLLFGDAMTQLDHLEELLAKATKGRLIAHGWGDGSTQMGMTNVFNEDAEVLLMECIPENDANLIVEAINALPCLIEDIRAMREALRPFAEQAELYDTCEQHTKGCPDDALAGESPDLTVGDFRAARRALAKETDNG